MHLTHDEEKAIASLKRVAKKWPKTLWLFSASGGLEVHKLRQDGQPALSSETGSVDPDYCVDVILGIRNDGGDY